MASAVTEGIRVTVESRYLAERSEPEDGSYAFAYRVAICNDGPAPVQLRRRHWIITDGNGQVREVEGPGVVGEEPVLQPGDVHEYTSGAILPTPVGTMHGSYEMHARDGRVFRADIPVFALQRPGVLH